VKFLDANIFLRYLVAGDESKANACFALFQRVKSGREVVTTSEAIVAEIAYVLRSRAHYALPPGEIAARLSPLLTLRGLKLPLKRTYLRALEIWTSYAALDFEDALTLAHLERLRLTAVTSYDTDFDQIANVERQEP